ncbi:metal-dependent transcriptional regulator [Salinicoccus sp. ID82-1]|uniref:Manganese transport regulator n=1 Tax=Salinicoccus cyprini TaxID=2493691 RepID=A0A558AVJ8_9STAP|nr:MULTISPECIES: metal-dependent transcriptional regulator [Salinicoccus]MCG1010335.1 metal-dependent transcriptional regulator [Salinicoccus sp. ID82-1]TVT28275.1 metal-dependent transcriptional regulator [Salinicoccus cyprini]
MSPTKEDYLKILFELGGRTEQVPNKEIANRLSISPPTVTEMMNSLVKSGWVVYTPYKGSKLTREGTDYAKRMIRKHRLWEVFLVKHLGFSINDVHSEAELLEHTTSSILADKLEQYLDYPEHCPHGGAISVDRMEEQEVRTIHLTEAETGTPVRISRIVDDEKLLHYFENHNLGIGDQVTVKERDSALDLITLHHDTSNKEIQISQTIAQYLFVEHI